MNEKEKAKRYDEAIEIAKAELRACGSQDCEAARLIFRLFPEFKVDEDEWIPQVGDTIRKKGTMKPLYVLCKKEGCEFSFIEERECGIAGGWLSIFALKGDYELVERPKTIEEVVNELFNPLKEAIDRQNPAWSEEDEMFVHGLIRGLAAKRNIHGHTTFSSDCIDITETINWLKSLKDRVQPQPKQEWSEEDENRIYSIIEGKMGYTPV